MPPGRKSWEHWATVLILAAWAAATGFHLGTAGYVPDGLQFDEAANALDALHLGQDGSWPLFFQGNFGREPLLMYLIALSFKLFGEHVWAGRLPSVLAWSLTFPALAWLIRELYPHSSRQQRARWLTAVAVLLPLPWFAIFAHFAIRAILFVLVQVLFFAALWRAWNCGTVRTACLAGFLGGLAFYTYLPNRLLPLVLFIGLIFGLGWRRPALRARWKSLVIVIVVAWLVMAPLLLHFARHPNDFWQRAAGVWVGTQQPEETETLGASALLADNTRRVAGMFFVAGDHNPRHNLAERPALSLWLLLPFVGGLLAVASRRSFRRVFVFSWLLVMLLPTWVTEYTPSFLRAIGAIPPLVLLVADGSCWLAGRLRPEIGSVAAWSLLALLLAGEAQASIRAYRHWVEQPALYYAAGEGWSQVGRYVAGLPADEVVYTTPVHENPILRFFIETAPDPPDIRPYDGRLIMVAAPKRDVTYVAVTHEDTRFEEVSRWLYAGRFPSPERVFTDREGQPYAKAFQLPADLEPREVQGVDFRWRDHIRLVGYDFAAESLWEPGGSLYLRLWWQPDGNPSRPWTIFTHLLGPDGALLAGDDSQPGGGSYPTDHWRADELLVTEYRLIIPPGAPAGAYRLEVGLYDLVSGVRLPLAHAQGDAVPIEEFTLGKPRRE